MLRDFGAIYKVKTNSGHSITATAKHPLLLYYNKQYEYKEIGEISIEYDKLLFIDNKLHTIESIKYVGMRNTYHISVVKYETFSTKGGFLHHNTGKALDVRTLIPTPFGWKTMGDLIEGDVVFDDNGKPCGFGIELADVIIRVLDLAEMLRMDMDHLILVKHMYNDSRPYKHGDRRV